jgi:pimeloyl-ACP methyl ester carboxylesterase
MAGRKLSTREKEPALHQEVVEIRSQAGDLKIAESRADPQVPDIEEKYVAIDGGRMRYLRAGSGPTLVLLHGLLGYSFSWRFTIPALSKYATVYAVDMLGTGFSDRVPQLDCCLRASAERLLRFLEVIGVSRFDLVGASHGGAVAMMLAAICADQDADPQQRRLQRLILAEPVNPWSAHGRRLAPLVGSRLGSFFFLHTVAHRSSIYGYWLRRLYGNSQRIPPGTLEGYAAPFKMPGTFEYAIGVTRHWTAGLRELTSELPKIADYSTLIIWGTRDRAVDPKSAEPLQKVFRHAQLLMIPDAGHLPYEETPEEFNRAVLNFLQSTSANS